MQFQFFFFCSKPQARKLKTFSRDTDSTIDFVNVHIISILRINSGLNVASSNLKNQKLYLVGILMYTLF